MLKEKGEEYMQKLQRDRRVMVNAHDHYSRLLIDYGKILNQL